MEKMQSTDPINHGVVICQRVRNITSSGVFYGGNPLKNSLPVLLFEMSLVMLITRIVRQLLKPLKQPRVISEILGGIIVGPSILGRSKEFRRNVFPNPSEYITKNMGLIGFMYFLFLSGVKMDLSSIQMAGKRQWYIALFGVIIPILTTSTVAILVRDTLEPAMQKGSSIWGVSSALAITAFPVLYPIIKELNLLSSDIGRMALATSVISDIIGINGIIYFEAAKQAEGKSLAAVGYILSFVIVLVSIMGGIRQLMLWIVKTTPEGQPVKQIYIVSILLGVMVVGFVSDMFGLAVANGPLWLGLAIPDGPPLGATLVQKSETFVMDVLMPFSFTYVGLITDVGIMREEWSSLRPLFFMALMGYMTKFVATFVITRYFDMELREGLALSLVMSLRGQVELLLFMHWMDFKMIQTPEFTMMVLLTTAVTSVATPMISIVYDPTKSYLVSRRWNIQHHPPNTELRIVACIYEEGNVAGVIQLLEVSNPSQSSPFIIYALQLTELVGRAAPIIIDHSEEERADEIGGSKHILNAFQNFQDLKSEFVEIRPFTLISPKKSMYQDICELALVNEASLIILPFQKDHVDSVVGSELVQNRVQSVNSTVLTRAPCSVGILVDRSTIRSQASMNSMTSFKRSSKRHFIVLFLGGADAREALAYADKMAGNSDVSLTVIRFLSFKGEGDDEMEKKLDDGLVTWFSVKNEGNYLVIYREIVVRNGDETIAVIQALRNERHYDLWIVGRQNGMNPVLVQGLACWSEYYELGLVGDYVASMDLESGTSVLVIQQQVLRDKKRESSVLGRKFSRCFA